MKIMYYVFVSEITYPLLILLVLISILGYGKILHYYLKINNFFFQAKNFIFILGLILVSFFTQIINIKFPISDNLSILIIILGIIFYIPFFFNNNDKKKEIFFIIVVILICYIFTFFSGVNDDYHYQYDTIQNFKKFNIFEITYNNRISYNSHWLFLNSIFVINYFPSTTYILSGLLYSLLIYDCYYLLKLSLKKKLYTSSVLSFSFLIFFLGVLNNYKEFGTDLPGTIISFYILILISYFVFDRQTLITKNIFLVVFILASFVFIIKITNSLIYLYLIIILFRLDKKVLNLKFLALVLIMPLMWFFQNINISGCLIWPIEITCFGNNNLATEELHIIKTFAKGDHMISIGASENLKWIKIWINNHLHKIIETYLIFLIIMIYPIIYILFKKLPNKKDFNKDLIFNIKNKKYLLFFISIVISNLIWFFYAPAYRFGIFYNITLIIFLCIPFWICIIKYDLLFIKKYCKIIIKIIFIYFMLENVLKIDWYMKRYDVWPPIINEELVQRKK